MKTIITAGLISVAATQVQAAGFYQDVIEGNTANGTEIRVNAPSDYVSPLYQTVTGGQSIKAVTGTVADVNNTFTPLYEVVTGKSQSRGQGS